MIALASGSSLHASVAALEYQETDYTVNNWSVSLASQSTPFKKEPAAASGRILRGVLNFDGGSSNAIPFLWQRDARRLYLDLNRNQDLTDDPAGVFVTGKNWTTDYQSFTNVHLFFNTASGQCRVLADLNIYAFGAQANCYLTVRSFWQGKLTLQERDWQVGLVQNVFGSAAFENSQLLLRPWEKRNQPFAANDGALACVPFSRKLFVDGHAYQLDCIAHLLNGEATPALQFTEQSVPLGEANITGQFIRRLVLTGRPYVVVVDNPVGVVKIPIGSYNQPDLQLEQKGVAAFSRNTGPFQIGKSFTVDGKTPLVLNVGGPLTNSLSATRHGQYLQLDYLLLGAGGQTYQLASQNRSAPPGFAVYQGEKEIASGTFEFG